MSTHTTGNRARAPGKRPAGLRRSPQWGPGPGAARLVGAHTRFRSDRPDPSRSRMPETHTRIHAFGRNQSSVRCFVSFFVKFGESFSTRTKSASPLFTVLPAFWERVSVKPSAHTLPPPLPTHPAGPPRRAGGLRPGPQLDGGLVSRASAIWQAKCFILLTCQSRHYVAHLVCI